MTGKYCAYKETDRLCIVLSNKLWMNHYKWYTCRQSAEPSQGHQNQESRSSHRDVVRYWVSSTLTALSVIFFFSSPQPQRENDRHLSVTAMYHTCKGCGGREESVRVQSEKKRRGKRKTNTLHAKRKMIISDIFFTLCLLFSVISSFYQFIWITINQTTGHNNGPSGHQGQCNVKSHLWAEPQYL